MAESLRNLKSKHQLIVMVTPQVTKREIFACLGATVIGKATRIPPTHTISEQPIIEVPSHVQLEHEWWAPSFTKLQLWNLIQYKKLIWIDGDSIIMQNIDDLFQFEELSGAQDFYNGEKVKGKICGGLMVTAPSLKSYHEMISLLYNDTSKIWKGGEQELVSYYFNQNSKVTILETYWSTFINPFCPDVENQKIGHWTHW